VEPDGLEPVPCKNAFIIAQGPLMAAVFLILCADLLQLIRDYLVSQYKWGNF
jgi:hypothetical protein